MYIIIITVTIFLLLINNINSYCMPNESCWPSSEDIKLLNDKLDPTIQRCLFWKQNHNIYPPTCSVPINSPDDQPLYGMNCLLKPLYTNNDFDEECFKNTSTTPSPFCLQSVRNNPMNNEKPAFVVWPTTTQHVISIILFAAKHNISVCAMSTGHEFLNRHTCDKGIMLRTTLLKEFEIDTMNNIAKVGAGNVVGEIHYKLSKYSKFAPTGWATTVGIVGWSIGGGHGPFSPYSGLGVDNFISADIVLSNGSLVSVNDTNEYSDLFVALRGGGGGVWGIITSLTIKTYDNPPGGITLGIVVWTGTLCNDMNILNNLIKLHGNWALELDSKWSGLTFIIPDKNHTICDKGQWQFFSYYVYLGNSQEDEFVSTWSSKLTHYKDHIVYNTTTTFRNWWERLKIKDVEYIIPIEYMKPIEGKYVGGVPSVLITRENVQEFSNVVIEHIKNDDWSRIEIYQSITGNKNSPQNNNTSISDGLRKAIFHVVLGGINKSNIEKFYQISKNSYFSESAYILDNWKNRYWDSSIYQQLVTIKNKYDPHHLFHCRHCIGS